MERILGLRDPGLDAADRLQEPSIGRYRWYWERRVRRNLQSRTRRTAASDVTYLLIEFRLADDGLRALARRRASPRRPIPGVATVILEQMGPSTTPSGR